jgi:hypothetical protein
MRRRRAGRIGKAEPATMLSPALISKALPAEAMAHLVALIDPLVALAIVGAQASAVAHLVALIDA